MARWRGDYANTNSNEFTVGFSKEYFSNTNIGGITGFTGRSIPVFTPSVFKTSYTGTITSINLEESSTNKRDSTIRYNGIYKNVPGVTTSGTGTGATFDVNIIGGQDPDKRTFNIHSVCNSEQSG